MYKLDMAARTCHIIHERQVEDLLQALDESTNTYDLHLSLRLSPVSGHIKINANVDRDKLVLPVPQKNRPQKNNCQV
jgi:hypothetical protein